MIKEFRNEYAWLSNFTPVKIIIQGIEFNSVEHAYMSRKSDDEGWVEFCANTKSAAEVKKASHKIKLKEGWNKIKFDIMYQYLEQKFNQEPFKTKLIETGNTHIMEGNWWNDTYWGVCLKKNAGENTLGKLIMFIRQDLINGHYKNYTI